MQINKNLHKMRKNKMKMYVIEIMGNVYYIFEDGSIVTATGNQIEITQ